MPDTTPRMIFLQLAVFVAIVTSSIGVAVATADRPEVEAPPTATVYKSQYCGCCEKWVDHLRVNGFEVTVINSSNMNAVKAEFGVPPQLASCHTALVNGRYVVEGHVPARDILRLLLSDAGVAGLAVPGMPAGSPGMEGPPPQPYTVYSFDENGRILKYQDHLGEGDAVR